MITEQNCTMLCDFYQLTMGNGYYNTRHADRIAYFDVFFRKVPDGGGYAVCAGLEQVINYIQGLHFTDNDIQYLTGRRYSARDSSNICGISSLPEISGLSRRARLCSRRSRC